MSLMNEAKKGGGTRISYLTDRLRTQHSDVFAALERGEYDSVHAATTRGRLIFPCHEFSQDLCGFIPRLSCNLLIFRRL